MSFEMRNKKPPIGKATQSFLRISEIKNDTVVMEDGSIRSIIAVSATNFDLKSQEEQDSIIFNFQRFLNSLEFSVQILMQSRKMEIGNYLEKLKRLAEKQTNELLRVQTNEYIEFISRLIENASIMNKHFYVIIPLGANIFPKAAGFFSKLLGNGKAREASERIENFERAKEQIDNRVNAVISNLSGVGVKGARLNTEQIIQLYYNSYNFDNAPIIDPSQLGEMKIVVNK